MTRVIRIKRKTLLEAVAEVEVEVEVLDKTGEAAVSLKRKTLELLIWNSNSSEDENEKV